MSERLNRLETITEMTSHALDRIGTEMQGLRTEIGVTRTELRADIRQLDTRLSGEIATLRAGSAGNFNGLRRAIHGLEIRAWGGIICAFLLGLTGIIYLGMHLPH